MTHMLEYRKRTYISPTHFWNVHGYGAMITSVRVFLRENTAEVFKFDVVPMQSYNRILHMSFSLDDWRRYPRTK